jgi:NAD(P)-dependent dehydrogenase (short-subunit alcohol dehydrogenase family)
MATVLITGAGRGIGLELARLYADRGDTVIGTVRSPEKAAALTALGAGVTVLPLDVTDEASHATLARTLAGRPIDILIANAGILGARGGLDDPTNTAALWTAHMATNVMGVFFTARTLAANVAAAKGRIAIISSRMGSSAAAGGNTYAYRASKAAAANLAANLAAELKPKGVAVAAYHPGWVRTDMGGPSAAIDPVTSARGLVTRIDALSLATTAAFEDYAGTPIAY